MNTHEFAIHAVPMLIALAAIVAAWPVRRNRG